MTIREKFHKTRNGIYAYAVWYYNSAEDEIVVIKRTNDYQKAASIASKNRWRNARIHYLYDK